MQFTVHDTVMYSIMYIIHILFPSTCDMSQYIPYTRVDIRQCQISETCLTQTEEDRQQATAEMNESAVGAMLEALSLSRTRRFCLMVEDECANLVRRNMLSHGAVCRLEFPPLSESLRDLISCTGLNLWAHFGIFFAFL